MCVCRVGGAVWDLYPTWVLLLKVLRQGSSWLAHVGAMGISSFSYRSPICLLQTSILQLVSWESFDHFHYALSVGLL